MKVARRAPEEVAEAHFIEVFTKLKMIIGHLIGLQAIPYLDDENSVHNKRLALAEAGCKEAIVSMSKRLLHYARAASVRGFEWATFSGTALLEEIRNESPHLATVLDEDLFWMEEPHQFASEGL